MILQKYTRFVDGTIPVAALLYNDEESYASQDTVGIYDGYVAFQHRFQAVVRPSLRPRSGIGLFIRVKEAPLMLGS